MKLSWYCSMCGKQAEAEIDLDKPLLDIEIYIQAKRWIVQHNGKNTDIYCSRKCAE